VLENPNIDIVPFQDPACFDLRWMFGAQIGKDTTSNFTLSLNGLAVRTVDNKFVVPVLENDTASLIDVTCMTIGIDPYVWRIPVAFESIERGHLLVRSDSPFSLLYVEEVNIKERRIHGIDPIIDQVVDIVVPERTLDVPSLLVRVVSLFDGLDGDGWELGRDSDGGEMGNLLPFLLCCGGNGAAGNVSNNLLLALALSKGGGGMGNLLPLLLLSSGPQSNPVLQTLLLASSFSGGKGLLGFGRKGAEHNQAGERPEHIQAKESKSGRAKRR
jgi:hypothetical protein